MKRTRPTTLAAAAAVALAAFSTVADAQWALVARRALGRVEQMSQQSPQSGGPSYDTAAVMLEVPVDRVYGAVVNGLAGKPELRVTREDRAAWLVQFTDGQQIAGIKLSPLSENLTHMMISSAHSAGQQDASALVLNAVLRVCREMNVDCSPAGR
ncbi:MAG: hypothetical protein U1F10_11215 [Burkholderiales bacterium]